MRADLIVTIDGPSGAGKSTIAKALAARLRYAYIDTGAMYRGVAYAYNGHGKPENIEGFLNGLNLRFEFKGDPKVYLNGDDISEGIRDPEISLLASHFSQNILVREYLMKIQRKIGDNGGVVLEGRDTGTVVFPYAHIKFYLDADPGERARRRYIELRSKGFEVDLKGTEEQMRSRDREDSQRDIAPLVIPDNAHYIDTTGISIDSIVENLYQIVINY